MNQRQQDHDKTRLAVSARHFRLMRAIALGDQVPTAAELRLAGIYAHSPGVPACPGKCGSHEGQLCDSPTGWCFERRAALATAWQMARAPVEVVA